MDTQGDSGDRTIHFWHRVPVQLGAGVLALTLGVAILASLVLSRRAEQHFSEQHITQAHAMASLIASHLASQMVAGGGSSVWKAVSQEAADDANATGTSRILVLTKAGIVKASSEVAANGTQVDMRNPAECPGCAGTKPEDFPASTIVSGPSGPQQLRVVNPLPASATCTPCHHDRQGDVRGYISIDFDLAPLSAATAEQRHSILAIALLASPLLVALIALLFRSHVMRPVTTLMRSMDRLARGDLSGRADVPGKGELAVMAGHFNTMAQRIEDQVARIEAAATESSLLYTLVVEVSRNLETKQVTSAVSEVIRKNLHPKHEVFFLEASDDDWTCTAGGEVEEASQTSGDGALESALASDSASVRQLLDGIPMQLVEDARRTQTLQVQRTSGGLVVALPVLNDARLVGLLACTAIPASIHLNEELLNNLGAHLMLAAANSRNYTGAITDPLTKLKSKRYGLTRLAEAVNAARRHGSALAVGMCDLDHFKEVNDTHGHPAGDAVLAEVGRRIAGCVRATDVACRYGGEEFLLVLHEANLQALQLIGEKVREAVGTRPVSLGTDRASLTVTLSIGLAAFRVDSDTAVTLTARADAALYRAKEAGRNRVELSL